MIVSLDSLVTLVDETYGNGDGAANAAAAGHEDMPGLFPLVTPDPTPVTPCGAGEWDGAPWQWWDNNMYAAIAEALIFCFSTIPCKCLGLSSHTF